LITATNKNDKIVSPELNKRLINVFFCFVTLLVLLNIFTPLRLNVDAIRYLNILQYLEGLAGKNSVAAHDFLPHGYPWLLFLLDKLHLLNPASITLINILSVLLACWVLSKLFPVPNKLLFFSLGMLSFINIKHFTLPLADQLFVLLFITAIYLWTEFFNGKRYYILPCLLLTALSIFVRTAGIALVPAVIFYIIYRYRKELVAHKSMLYAGIILLCAGIIVFFAKLSFLETKVDYLNQLKLMAMIGEPYSILERFSMHFKEIGEAILNIPYSKLTGIIKVGSFDTAEYLLIIIGILAVYIFIRAIIRLKLYDQYIFWAFLSYLVMIFLWPFYDTRFLLPVVPLLIYLFFTYLIRFVNDKRVKIVSFVVYVLLGMVSLLYSDALSLNRNFFLNHYGFDGQLTNEYRTYYNNRGSASYNIDTNNVQFLLEKYNR
jgi:hypothetical protein